MAIAELLAERHQHELVRVGLGDRLTRRHVATAEWLIEHGAAIPSEEELHDSGVQDAEVLRLKEKARHSLTGNAGADRSHRNTCAVFPSVIDSLSDTRVMCTNWTRTCPQT